MIPTQPQPPTPTYKHQNQQVQSVLPYYCDEPGGAPPSRSLGAFHPKMYLLVTRASLVVVVSTANLGSQATVDMSWVQSFPRRHQPQPQQQLGSIGFGRALTDFLARIEESLGHQAWQSRKTEGEAAGAGTEWNGPLSFLRRHLGSSELDAMVR